MTTAEAAARLGVTPRRVVAMIRDGVLPARRVGRDWHVTCKAITARQRLVKARKEAKRNA